MLAGWRAWHVQSAPYTPQYATSIEAGAGLMKNRLAEHWMDTEGEHELSPENLEDARLRLNETSHRGVRGPSLRWSGG